MQALAHFVREIGGVPYTDDPLSVRKKSRDQSFVSPILRRELAGRVADIVVSPRDKAELFAVIEAAVRHRLPLTVRGGGTANYGQSVPLQGGILIDMLSFAGVLSIEEGAVRALAGTRMLDIDMHTRRQGMELRVHPSTTATATIAGFVAGGQGGMGSCTWGMLRERGNIIALEVVSIEDEPRTIELRGSEIQLVQHAYGTNGIITEVEMPLAAAWPWRETIVAFTDFPQTIRFGVQLAKEVGIVKKLISLIEWRIPKLMEPLAPLVPSGHSAANLLIASASREAVQELAADFGGTIVSDCREGEGPYGRPLYEFAFGHGQLHIQKSEPRYTCLQGALRGDDLVAAFARVHRHFGPSMPFKLEIVRGEGEVAGTGSPFFLYQDEAHMARLAATMESEGMHVANTHTTGVREVGIKRLGERDEAFRRIMDPHDLLNPGKRSAAPETAEPAAVQH
jgi:FAD/FMN-containing dehydrogenase